MAIFISILRGINVSGKNKILMADLKSWYEEIGFRQVTTYIQSGNVVFQSSDDIPTSTLAEQISRLIISKTGFMVPVIVRKLEEMQMTVRSNPFKEELISAPDRLHVTFLSEIPHPDRAAKLSDYSYPPDQFRLSGKDIYLFCPESYGNTKFSNAFFESKLKVTATTRNWATILKLASW